MLKKIMSFGLALVMLTGLLCANMAPVSAAEQEVFFTRGGYTWMWGDWATWSIWGINYEKGNISNGVFSPEIKTNPENGLNGKYRTTDMVIAMFDKPQQVNKLVLKASGAGQFPQTVKVQYRDASIANPTDITLATDAWAVSRDFGPEESLTVNVNLSGDTMTILFSETVNANAIMVQATEPADQTVGGANAWTVKEMRAYNGATGYSAPGTVSSKGSTLDNAGGNTGGNTVEPSSAQEVFSTEPSSEESVSSEAPQVSSTVPASADQEEEKGNSGWIYILVAVLIVVAGAGAFTVLYFTKFKNQKPPENPAPPQE